MLKSPPFELSLAWKYLFPSPKRSGSPISFYAMLTVVGIALGVAALVVAMSVFNGFGQAVQERLLRVTPAVTVHLSDPSAASNWQELASAISRAAPNKVAALQPALWHEALMVRGDMVRAVLVRGVARPDGRQATVLMGGIQRPLLEELSKPGPRRIVLGVALARVLRVKPGDEVTLSVAQVGALSPSVEPRFHAFTVSGLFESGHHTFDDTQAYIDLAVAQAVFGVEGPNAIEIGLHHPQDSGPVAADINSLQWPGVHASEWTQLTRSWTESLAIQKRMIQIILTLIVAVAAFNLVSTLVMLVMDKRPDIAILRTMGASPGAIVGIYVLHGALTGGLGTLVGGVAGVLLSLNLGNVVASYERVTATKLLDAGVYLIDHLPTRVEPAEVVGVMSASMLLSLLATLYPSWRASHMHPVEGLRGA